jgi:protein-tyrosine phosphatase
MMTSILFVCHGNICRSPMAHFVMQQLVEELGVEKDFFIDSKATSTEEIGNPPYPPARRKMQQMGIRQLPHRASQIEASDYERFDFIVGMDSANIRNMKWMFGGDPQKKISRLRDYSDGGGDIADPWYTGDFDTTYAQVIEGCRGLLRLVLGKNKS